MVLVNRGADPGPPREGRGRRHGLPLLPATLAGRAQQLHQHSGKFSVPILISDGHMCLNQRYFAST